MRKHFPVDSSDRGHGTARVRAVCSRARVIAEPRHSSSVALIGALLGTLKSRAIPPSAVQPDGPLTSPRSFGMYELPAPGTGTRRFRYGNHPVRMHELERVFGSCTLRHLFLRREDAGSMAAQLNRDGP